MYKSHLISGVKEREMKEVHYLNFMYLFTWYLSQSEFHFYLAKKVT